MKIGFKDCLVNFNEREALRKKCAYMRGTVFEVCLNCAEWAMLALEDERAVKTSDCVLTFELGVNKEGKEYEYIKASIWEKADKANCNFYGKHPLRFFKIRREPFQHKDKNKVMEWIFFIVPLLR